MATGVLRSGAAILLTMAATLAAAPPASTHRTTKLCKPFQHITTIGQTGARFIVRNDNFGGKAECLSNENGWSNFKVRISKAGARGVESLAYPDIFRGCSWGVCSPRSGMPVRVSRLKSLNTSWYTSLHASGRWAATYDIWFDRTGRISGQNDGAELMLWINTRGFGHVSRALIVNVVHTRWRLMHWVVVRGGKSWNYIQFRRVHPAAHVHRLALRPFIQLCKRLRWIGHSWWLTGVEAGFEIWRGGAGLATTRFWAGLPHR